ncbi:uncharacterized protein EV420DRAFT_41922 [Desarmillaria tabescens]|uniref:Uncharacterized protein n=1 Tax=Armillaria tabescens TaxID=1929756 RepID=A0AA39U2V6_ARMTA|nr:uncharacterized protein EV420DRAFT_41922 [Desarmillaria tabescens]KAK0469559.1 hypothetical protein EV420DRAFT_41922 [Desarmillaria tabescens]
MGYDLVEAEFPQYSTSNLTWVIFDAFAEERIDDAHRCRKITEALAANPEASLKEAPWLVRINMLASEVENGVEKVRDGLRCLSRTRPSSTWSGTWLTPSPSLAKNLDERMQYWYVFESPGSDLFGTTVFLLSDEGKQAHIERKFVAAMMQTPMNTSSDIVKAQVLAAKIAESTETVPFLYKLSIHELSNESVILEPVVQFICGRAEPYNNRSLMQNFTAHHLTFPAFH